MSAKRYGSFLLSVVNEIALICVDHINTHILTKKNLPQAFIAVPFFSCFLNLA